MALIAMASAVVVPATICLTLTLCLFCGQRSKKRALEDYTNLIRANPSATLPGNPDKKLLDCLHAEWEEASRIALTQSKSTIKKTTMGDCFKNLQECKFAHMLETFRGFLKKDLTEAQRQKVQDLIKKMRKKFDAEMRRLASPLYTPRMRFGIMIDFFIILEDEIMEEAIRDGLVDFWLPRNEFCCDHFSMSGGGAQGYAYGGILKKFRRYFAPNCKFSGTSIGSIAACFAALDLPNFEKTAVKMQKRYRKSRRANEKWAISHGFLRAQLKDQSGYFDPIGLIALLDECVQNKISEVLKDVTIEVIDATFPDDAKARERMWCLRESFDRSVSREGRMPTFQDLGNIQKLLGEKAQIHDLAMAIWDRTDQKVIFAKKETQPNMPIALAAYASMAIPLIFPCLALRLDQSDGKAHLLCDGGINTNLPIHAYQDGYSQNSTGGKTFGAIFDDDGLGGQTLCGNVQTLSPLLLRFAEFLGVSHSARKNDVDQKRRLGQNLENLILVPSGKLGTLSFNFPPADRGPVNHQVSRRAKAWIICQLRGGTWPQSN
jgi:predicted acylesterase/phospholipase RssA